MIIKTRSTRIPLLVALAALAIVAFLSLNKQRLREEAFAVVDTVVAQDWGISGLSGLYDNSFVSQNNANRTSAAKIMIQLPGILARSPGIISSKIRSFPQRPFIDRIDIDVKFEDYQKILADRRRAIENGMLSDPQEVKARIWHNGKRMKAEIRLKGDLYDHWRSRTSMSLRVSLKDKDTLFGFAQFSLHKPGSRQFPYDYVFEDFVREASGMSARHNFVRVTVNGQNWGIMDIEEHMSKELLEKQQKKESIILKFGDEQKWFYDTVAVQPYGHYRLSDRTLYIAPFQEGKYLKDPLFRAQYSYVVRKFRMHQEKDILDTESFSRAAFAALVWNSYHALSNGNSRFYFNPYTLKLEPITTDQAAFEELEGGKNPVEKLYQSDLAWLYKSALASSEGRKRFKRNLGNVLAAAQKIPSLQAYYQSFFPNDTPRDFNVIEKNIEIVREFAEPLPEQLIPETKKPNGKEGLGAEQAQNLPLHIMVRHYDDGWLELINLLDVPVRLESVTYEGSAANIPPQILPPYSQNDGTIKIDTKKNGLQDDKFEITTSVMNSLKTVKSGPTLITRLFNPLEDDRNAPPGWIKQDGSNYLIEAGIHAADRPIVISGGLMIAAGATLRFAPDAYLIIKGGPLIAEGTAEKPVIFEPAASHWKGLYVLESERISTLRHTIIRDTDFFRDGLLSLTGGINFYKAPVHLRHIKITGTIAEDALNIIHSDFLISDSLISGSRSDALDSDFSNGSIEDTAFENIGGDATDFSGSRVTIENLTARAIRDKALSAGEQSTVSIKNSHFEDVGVGIASKDGSAVTANAVTVRSYALYAAMTYVKKGMFGPSNLHASRITQEGQTPFLRQTGTTMDIDGAPVKESTMDVDSMYKEGIMKK
ncbi:MAG: CotH kinase family protein [Proteobacteria bacterium]|nr:CotH kinase family protein [Pseudomonadota bacterium]